MYLKEWVLLNNIPQSEIARRTKYSKQVISLACMGSGYCANKKLIEKIKKCFPEGEKCTPNGICVWKGTNELEPIKVRREKKERKVIKVWFTEYEKDLVRKYNWVIQNESTKNKIFNGELFSEKIHDKIMQRVLDEKARCEEIDRKIASGEFVKK